MSNKSSKHHYIPEFFTKGFTNENGFLYVYDKKLDLVHHKKKSPSSIFFEMGRNTGRIEDKEFDEIETTYYRVLDNTASRWIEQLRAHINPIELINANKIVELNWFIKNLFWRLPKNDGLYEQIYPHIGVKFDSKVGTSNTNEELISDAFKQVDLFKKWIRADIAFRLSDTDNMLEVPIVVDLLRFEGKFLLLGDYPIVYKNEPRLFSDMHKDIIFPISADRLLLILSKENYKARNVKFLSFLNMFIIHQAQRYVVSHELDLLTDFVDLYKVHIQMKEPLSSEVLFDLLYS